MIVLAWLIIAMVTVGVGAFQEDPTVFIACLIGPALLGVVAAFVWALSVVFQ